MMIPSRLKSLAAQIEQGQPLTDDDVRRTLLLQAFDLASAGDALLNEINAAERAADDQLAEFLGVAARN